LVNRTDGDRDGQEAPQNSLSPAYVMHPLKGNWNTSFCWFTTFNDPNKEPFLHSFNVQCLPPSDKEKKNNLIVAAFLLQISIQANNLASKK
jgi:hypothetical protein